MCQQIYVSAAQLDPQLLSNDVNVYNLRVLYQDSRGAAKDRGSICASHQAAPGLNPGPAEIFSQPLSSWTYRTHLVFIQGILQMQLAAKA